MASRLLRKLALLAALAALAAGCGASGSKEAAGAKVFTSAGCGGCHTLSAAKSNGQTGPNLDALKPGYDTIVRQVSNGGNGMPAFQGKLKTNQIRAVAAFVASSAKSSGGSLLQFHPSRQRLANCHRDYACDRQAFGNLAYAEGPGKALAELQATMARDPTVNSGCHQIAHEIGHAAFERYHGDAARALGNGAMTCWSGYYHGVIERAFGGVPRSSVAAKARSLCTQMEATKSAFVAYQCVHGLGHGLMIYSGNDLRYALSVCNKLASQWDRHSCTGGVFMQNFLPGPMQIGTTKWLKSSDLIYPCDAVAQHDKIYCYLMVTSRILPVVHYNWRRAASWCRRAERGWIATCFQSFGRDASGSSVQDPRKIVSICPLAGSMERECIYGASRDLTSNDAGGRRSTRMCELAPAWTRSYCFNGIGTILGGFQAYAPGRRAECNRYVPRAYRLDCYRGARA